MVAFFTELNNNLINLLNDTEKFKYIFIWRTVEPIPSRVDDDDFIETRKVGKYLQFEVDKMMDRTPIDLYVLYFKRKKPGYVQVDLDEDTAHEKYTEYLKVGILNQVGCLQDTVKNTKSKYRWDKRVAQGFMNVVRGSLFPCRIQWPNYTGPLMEAQFSTWLSTH